MPTPTRAIWPVLFCWLAVGGFAAATAVQSAPVSQGLSVDREAKRDRQPPNDIRQPKPAKPASRPNAQPAKAGGRSDPDERFGDTAETRVEHKSALPAEACAGCAAPSLQPKHRVRHRDAECRELRYPPERFKAKKGILEAVRCDRPERR